MYTYNILLKLKCICCPCPILSLFDFRKYFTSMNFKCFMKGQEKIKMNILVIHNIRYILFDSR